MPKLVDLNITEISGVDKAANGRRFLIIKRAGGGDVVEDIITKALTDDDKSAYKADLGESSTQDLTAGHRRIHQWAGSGALPTGLSKTDLVWMHNALVDELRRRFKEENSDEPYHHDSPLKVEDIPDSPGEVEKCKAITNLTSRVKQREEKKVKKGGDHVSDDKQTQPVHKDESRAQALWRFVKGLFGSGDRVEKSESASAKTVDEIMAERQKTEVLWDLIYALQDSIWSILEDDTVTDKASAVLETTSQFQAQVVGSVVKRGAKISADRLARLKQAHDLLGQIIGEAEVKDDDTVIKAEPAGTETAGGAQPPEARPGAGADLETAVQKALEPLLERLAVLEQPAAGAGDAGTSVASVKPAGTEPPPVEAAISKALEPILARIEGLEKARGIKKSIDGQDGSTKESLWAGIL
jgi:hypothetical protein